MMLFVGAAANLQGGAVAANILWPEQAEIRDLLEHRKAELAQLKGAAPAALPPIAGVNTLAEIRHNAPDALTMAQDINRAAQLALNNGLADGQTAPSGFGVTRWKIENQGDKRWSVELEAELQNASLAAAEGFAQQLAQQEGVASASLQEVAQQSAKKGGGHDIVLKLQAVWSS